MRSTVEERVLLHLKNHLSHISGRTASYTVCQQGIADAVGASLSQVSRTVRQMKKDGLIEEDKRYMEGEQERKRKVYALTTKGASKEKKIRNKFKEQYFILNTPEEEVKIKGNNLGSYINDADPLLYALARLNKNEVVELEPIKQEKEPSFVNRKAELSRLKSELREVRKSGCKALFIAGETGIGKTTLVKEFKKYASKEGFNFLEGNAHFETSEPYLPFKKAFDRYEKKGRGYEKKLDPKEVFSYRGMKKDDELFHDERHSAFFEFMKELRKRAKKAPVVISLDDLQWSDAATLELLYYMINNLKDTPVFLVCTYRPEEISSSHPFYNIRNRLSRQQRYEEIELKPFGLENTRKLLYSITNNSRLSNDLVEQIYQITEGTPLYIIEFTDLLIKEGKITEDPAITQLDEDRLNIPKVIEDVIKRRLTINTSKDGRNLIDLGSVIGDDIPFELLLNCSRMDKLDLLDTIDELLKQDIWVEDAEDGSYSFSHFLINEVAYQNISAVKKEKLHLFVADKIKEFYENQINEYYSDIAYHYRRGDKPERAVEYYLKAGEEPESVFAHEDAIMMYENALELEVEDSEKRIIILDKLGEVHKIIGEYEESLRYFEKVMDEGMGQRLKLKVLREKSGILVNQGQYDEALKTIEECLSICEENDKIRCKLLNSKGWIYMLLGDLNDASKVFEKEIKVATELGEKKDIGQAIHDSGTVELQKGKLDTSLERLNKALEIRENAGDIKGMAATLNNIGMIYWYKDLDKALEYYEQSLKIRKKTGEKRYVSMALNNIGSLYIPKGHFDKALRYQERSLEIKESIGDKGGVAMSLVNIGNIYFEKGEIDIALEYYERSLKIRENIGDKRGVAASISNIGMVYRFKNKVEQALDHYERTFDLCEEIGEKQTLIDIYSELGLTYVDIGKQEIAMKHAEKAFELCVDSGADALKGQVHRVLGVINRKKGDLDTAENELMEARELLEGVGNIVDLTKAIYDLGVVMVKRGDLDKGKKNLKDALERFERMGMEWWTERCEEKLSKLS